MPKIPPRKLEFRPLHAAGDAAAQRSYLWYSSLLYKPEYPRLFRNSGLISLQVLGLLPVNEKPPALVKPGAKESTNRLMTRYARRRRYAAIMPKPPKPNNAMVAGSGTDVP